MRFVPDHCTLGSCHSMYATGASCYTCYTCECVYDPLCCYCLPINNLPPLYPGSIVEYALKRWSEDQPAPEVRELVDQAIWETECIGFNEPGLEKVRAHGQL